MKMMDCKKINIKMRIMLIHLLIQIQKRNSLKDCIQEIGLKIKIVLKISKREEEVML